MKRSERYLNLLARASVERHDRGVKRREEDLVVIERQTAGRR